MEWAQGAKGTFCLRLFLIRAKMLAIMDDDWGVGPQDHQQSGCLQRLDLLALEDAAAFFCSQRGEELRKKQKS